MMITSTISTSLKIGLHFLGVWPGVPYSAVYLLLYMSSIPILQFFQYLYVVAHRSELPNLVENLPVTIEYGLTFLKLAAIWIHRRVIHQMLADMNCDWRECINVDRQLHVMTIKANISHFLSKAMVSFNVIAVIIFVLGNYAISVNMMEGNNDTSPRQFPIKIQLPLETYQSPIFELLTVTLLLHSILNGYTLAIMNALLFSLVLHVSGQIDIICQELKIMSRKTLVYASGSTLEMLIEKHNRVISFSGNIDKLFSFIALMQAIFNTLIICPLGIIVITSLDSGIDVILLMRGIITYIAVMIEVFIFCFAGEYLSLKSKSIADAAYESLWYDIPLNQRKIISLIILRSQKQLTITAGRITNLSLEAFASIMKASASYISVLYAIY